VLRREDGFTMTFREASEGCLDTAKGSQLTFTGVGRYRSSQSFNNCHIDLEPKFQNMSLGSS
jgi:hypothetical protein